MKNTKSCFSRQDKNVGSNQNSIANYKKLEESIRMLWSRTHEISNKFHNLKRHVVTRSQATRHINNKLQNSQSTGSPSRIPT